MMAIRSHLGCGQPTEDLTLNFQPATGNKLKGQRWDAFKRLIDAHGDRHVDVDPFRATLSGQVQHLSLRSGMQRDAADSTRRGLQRTPLPLWLT